jgi:hypothetical protein
MSVETKLGLILAIATARIVRKTLAGAMRIDSKHMAMLCFDTDLLKRIPCDALILGDVMRNPVITAQLEEAGNSGVILLPWDKKRLQLLFPHVNRSGLMLVALQPHPNSSMVEKKERLIHFDGEGGVNIGYYDEVSDTDPTLKFRRSVQ